MVRYNERQNWIAAKNEILDLTGRPSSNTKAMKCKSSGKAEWFGITYCSQQKSSLIQEQKEWLENPQLDSVIVYMVINVNDEDAGFVDAPLHQNDSLPDSIHFQIVLDQLLRNRHITNVNEIVGGTINLINNSYINYIIHTTGGEIIRGLVVISDAQTVGNLFRALGYSEEVLLGIQAGLEFIDSSNLPCVVNVEYDSLPQSIRRIGYGPLQPDASTSPPPPRGNRPSRVCNCVIQ